MVFMPTDRLSCAQFAGLAKLLAAPGGVLPVGEVYAAMQGHGIQRARIGRAAMAMCELRFTRYAIADGDTPATFTITAAGRAVILEHLLPAAEAAHV